MFKDPQGTVREPLCVCDCNVENSAPPAAYEEIMPTGTSIAKKVLPTRSETKMPMTHAIWQK